MATINTELKEYHFYGKDMVEGVYYRKADVDELIESLKAVHNIELLDPPKPRRATNRELSRWLAQGNGQIQYDDKTKNFGKSPDGERHKALKSTTIF